MPTFIYLHGSDTPARESGTSAPLVNLVRLYRSCMQHFIRRLKSPSTWNMARLRRAVPSAPLPMHERQHFPVDHAFVNPPPGCSFDTCVAPQQLAQLNTASPSAYWHLITRHLDRHTERYLTSKIVLNGPFSAIASLSLDDDNLRLGYARTLHAYASCIPPHPTSITAIL